MFFVITKKLFVKFFKRGTTHLAGDFNVEKGRRIFNVHVTFQYQNMKNVFPSIFDWLFTQTTLFILDDPYFWIPLQVTRILGYTPVRMPEAINKLCLEVVVVKYVKCRI